MHGEGSKQLCERVVVGHKPQRACSLGLQACYYWAAERWSPTIPYSTVRLHQFWLNKTGHIFNSTSANLIQLREAAGESSTLDLAELARRFTTKVNRVSQFLTSR